MVGLTPFTVWAAAAATTSTTTSTTSSSTRKLVPEQVQSLPISSNSAAAGDKADCDSSVLDFSWRRGRSRKPLSLGKTASSKQNNKKPRGGAWVTTAARDAQKKLSQGITLVLMNSDLLLNVVKVALPILWLANVARMNSPLSTATMLASLTVVVSSPLVGSSLLSTTRNKKRINNFKRACHNFIRDSGLFRTLMNVTFAVGLPTLIVRNPTAVSEFRRLGSHCTGIQYGRHKAQRVDVYMPSKCTGDTARGLIFFVHGGAWGSGSPKMYRLAAKAFLERGMAVAVVGYRTYPEGDTQTQVEDLELAAAQLTNQYPNLCLGDSELGVIIIGHSSGAHVCSMMMVERLRAKLELDCVGVDATHGSMKIDSFIGISGPYDIARHFDYEASRGLEELSPMQPACGGKEGFAQNSPTRELQKLLSQCSQEEIEAIDAKLPRVALCHGRDDNIVPMQSTEEAVSELRSCGVTKCDGVYFSDLGHSEIIEELMFGGKAQDVLLDWIEEASTVDTSS